MAIDDNTSYELTGAQVKDLASKINAKADASSVPAAQVNSDWNAVSGVAEILNKPTIPTVNDGTLTIQHNGTTKGTFTANQSTASTVNIETIYADDYISTSPIPTTVTTAMIENGAVTAAKIDYSSVGGALQYVARFPINRQTYNNAYFVFNAPSVILPNSDITVSRASSNTQIKFALPANGTYVVHVSFQLWTGSNSWDYMLVALRKNGDAFTRVMAPKISGTWGFCSTQGWQTIANDDYISAYINTSGNNFTDGNISAQDSFVEIAIYRVG